MKNIILLPLDERPCNFDFPSSAPVEAPARMESPKSNAARPGITVSRSMTHTASPVALSIKTLLIFVSLCVTFSGSLPSSSRFIKSPQSVSRAFANSSSAATFFKRPALSSRTASISCRKRAGVS